MNPEQSEKLRERWGDKPCDHPHLVKERIMGMDTMDKVCDTCGSVFSPQELKNMKSQND